MPKFDTYNYIYTKTRFQEDSDIPEKYESLFSFSILGQELFKKAIAAAVKSSVDSGGLGGKLPLQGIVDLDSKLIHIGALTPRNADAFVFNEEPIFEHKQPGLFETGRYSPRLFSYQKKYSDGPSAHQQLLQFAVNKPVVSCDDAENKRGIAINIQVTGDIVTIYIDGKSLSINQTAQYLRTVHQPGHVLSEHEAKNEVLKESGIYSEYCESWLFDKIAEACKNVIDEGLMLDGQVAKESLDLIDRPDSGYMEEGELVSFSNCKI